MIQLFGLQVVLKTWITLFTVIQNLEHTISLFQLHVMVVGLRTLRLPQQYFNNSHSAV